MRAVSVAVDDWVGVKRMTLGVVVVMALVVGIGLGMLLDGGEVSEDAQPPPASQGPGPTSEVNGVPVGYARTEEGAVLAATNFALVTTGFIERGEAEYLAANEALWTPSRAEQARDEAGEGYDFATEHYGSDVRMASSILRYRTLEYSAEKARVQLWTITVAAGSDRPEAETIWGTSTLSLEWADGDWRVAATENQPGPAPLAMQTPASRGQIQVFMEEASGFAEGPRP